MLELTIVSALTFFYPWRRNGTLRFSCPLFEILQKFIFSWLLHGLSLLSVVFWSALTWYVFTAGMLSLLCTTFPVWVSFACKADGLKTPSLLFYTIFKLANLQISIPPSANGRKTPAFLRIKVCSKQFSN